VRDLASKLAVETPISDAVAAILAGETDVDAAIAELLARPLKSETDS
jgi:glycerol-3-phosphate dehydrogenase (NAD(P)+)